VDEQQWFFHSSDDITAVDDPTVSTAGQIPTEIEANRPKKRNSLPILKHVDRNGKVSYPFLENSDDRDITLFTTLTVAKLFATAKGKGIMEAWQAAVDDLNSQINKAT
jgi:PDZ domain-containing secreted protein